MPSSSARATISTCSSIRPRTIRPAFPPQPKPISDRSRSVLPSRRYLIGRNSGWSRRGDAVALPARFTPRIDLRPFGLVLDAASPSGRRSVASGRYRLLRGRAGGIRRLDAPVQLLHLLDRRPVAIGVVVG